MPIKKTPQLTVQNFAAYFLIVIIVTLLFVLFGIYSPFWNILIFATLFATIFLPIFKKLRDLFGGHQRIASIVTCILVLFVIIIPLGLFLILLVNEGMNAFSDIFHKLNSGFFDQYTVWWKEGNFMYDQFQSLTAYISSFGGESFDITGLNFDIIGQITSGIAWFTKNSFETISNFLANIIWFIFSFFIFFFF